MSDYEVTLVNDNSMGSSLPPLLALPHVALSRDRPLTPAHLSVSATSDLEMPRAPLTKESRQEFYVRFKGPAESQFSPPVHVWVARPRHS